MSDFKIEIKIKNGKIAKLMEDHGINTVAELCRESGLESQQTLVGKIVNMTETPLTKHGVFRSAVIVLSEYFGIPPEEMFPDNCQFIEKLKSNRSHKYVTKEQIMDLVKNYELERIKRSNKELDQIVYEKDLNEKIIPMLLSWLTPTQKTVVEMRFGLKDGHDRAIDEVAESLDISTFSVQEHVQKAMFRIKRHASLNGIDINELFYQ
jgi:DNA-binding CsgD family transcriptional regulator